MYQIFVSLALSPSLSPALHLSPRLCRFPHKNHSLCVNIYQKVRYGEVTTSAHHSHRRPRHWRHQAMRATGMLILRKCLRCCCAVRVPTERSQHHTLGEYHRPLCRNAPRYRQPSHHLMHVLGVTSLLVRMYEFNNYSPECITATPRGHRTAARHTRQPWRKREVSRYATRRRKRYELRKYGLL